MKINQLFLLNHKHTGQTAESNSQAVLFSESKTFNANSVVWFLNECLYGAGSFYWIKHVQFTNHWRPKSV